MKKEQKVHLTLAKFVGKDKYGNIRYHFDNTIRDKQDMKEANGYYKGLILNDKSFDGDAPDLDASYSTTQGSGSAFNQGQGAGEARLYFWKPTSTVTNAKWQAIVGGDFSMAYPNGTHDGSAATNSATGDWNTPDFWGDLDEDITYDYTVDNEYLSTWPTPLTFRVFDPVQEDVTTNGVGPTLTNIVKGTVSSHSGSFIWTEPETGSDEDDFLLRSNFSFGTTDPSNDGSGIPGGNPPDDFWSYGIDGKITASLTSDKWNGVSMVEPVEHEMVFTFSYVVTVFIVGG